MRIKLLSALIGGLLASQVVQAETTLVSMGEQTKAMLEQMHQLAQDPQNVLEHENGSRYLKFQGKEYLLNHESYPKFPFSDMNGEFSSAFPFVDDAWEFTGYSGGFYLMHRTLGVMNDDSGCYVEYVPAARGSQNDDGSYIWESELILQTVMSDCGELSKPEISDLQAGSISDVGVELIWNSPQEEGEYRVELTSQREFESPITFNYDAKSSGFYMGTLEPETDYEVKLSSCNAIACDAQTFNFKTLPARLSYNDSRKATNHLTGNFRAHVNFAQTHTSVMPNANDDVKHPNLVMKREAQLLVTPQRLNFNQLWVDVEVEGVSMGRFAMLPPSALPGTDQPDNGRSKVVFSHHAWSFPLSWEWMKPGLSLRFTDNMGREGVLSEGELVFGGAPEMVIQNIDIGMLVEPRNSYEMIDRMPELATDYYQKIPVSKLVMADYTPLHLRKVTLPNGKVYTKASEYDNPSVYAGDMRSYITKGLVSMGINYANYGMVNTAGGDAKWPRPFSHITAHNSQGRYLAKDQETGEVTSKVVIHGLSGGGGMVTLRNTRGNEWSHELGHNYGRGHHPKDASVHDMESGWGWDARYNRFIGNIHWSAAAETVENDKTGESVPPFADEFRFMREAMGGGESPLTGLISNYTLEHPISARMTQDWFNRTNNLDATSSTGYSSWDHSQQRYVESTPDFAAPTQQGVPVITVLGIYDPAEINASQVYPLIYSNYGNVFELPQPSSEPVQLEGWQAVADLSESDRASTEWQNLEVDDQWLPLCQFNYTNNNGDNANFVGYEDAESQVCRATSDMYWLVNGKREIPASQVNEYQLLSTKGELVGNVTYTPTPEIGEQELCSLNNDTTAHDGAGFILDGKCKQVDGVKHRAGALWAYTANRTGVETHKLVSQKQCQLIVENENGSTDHIALASSRFNSAESNKFHINLPADVHPTKVTISCASSSGVESVLDSQNTPRNPAADKLVGPVIIGQEHGYEALESGLPSGWFAHTEHFDPEMLTVNEKTLLATVPVIYDNPYLCRFSSDINGVEKTLFGYVEAFGNGDFQCTGGSEITIEDSESTRSLESSMNQFEWLSLSDREHVGNTVKAKLDSDAKLCKRNKNATFYGAGFVNDKGQCAQEQEVRWSNGNHWAFSSSFTQYTYR
ncbi:TagA-related metallopeptidase [Aliivibrio wodanis]|uniref:TagA-related metallopeptidase n=1 Tax=Aliivibrio wodanis TaxID=80852 RepID=A0A090IW57_9GAMM|nr:TagA-related metallopeptidase [Aliivibrio wodanis]